MREGEVDDSKKSCSSYTYTWIFIGRRGMCLQKPARQVAFKNAKKRRAGKVKQIRDGGTTRGAVSSDR